MATYFGELAATLSLMHADTWLGLVAASGVSPLHVGMVCVLGNNQILEEHTDAGAHSTEHCLRLRLIFVPLHTLSYRSHLSIVSQLEFGRVLDAYCTIFTSSSKRGRKDSHQKMTIKQESNLVHDMDSINEIVSYLSINIQHISVDRNMKNSSDIGMSFTG